MKNRQTKKARRILYFLLAVCCANPIFAQAFAKEYQLNRMSNSPTIIRSTDAGDMLMFHRDSSETLYHFTWRPANSNSAKTFAMVHEANMLGGIGYQIHDMQVEDGICFFCGKKTIPIERIPTGGFVYKHVGFVGMFQLDVYSLAATSPIDYFIFDVDKTLSLDKLTSYQDGVRTMFAAIGIPDTAGTEACVAVFDFNLGAGITDWKYSLKHTTNSTEHFIDIAKTAKHLVISSRRDDGDSNWAFYIRRGISGDIASNNNMMSLDDIFRFNTSAMTTMDPTLPEQTTHRRNDASIRMSGNLNDDVFYLAYESRTPNSSALNYSMSLYKMSIVPYGSVFMNRAMVLPGQYIQPNTFKDIVYLYDNNMVALLHSNDEETANPSVVNLLRESTSSSPIDRLVFDDIFYTSMKDDNSGNFIYMGGTRSGTYKVVEGYQKMWSPEDKYKSCSSVESDNAIDMTTVNCLPQSSVLDFFKQEGNVDWGARHSLILPYDFEAICTAQ